MACFLSFFSFLSSSANSSLVELDLVRSTRPSLMISSSSESPWMLYSFGELPGFGSEVFELGTPAPMSSPFEVSFL